MNARPPGGVHGESCSFETDAYPTKAGRANAHNNERRRIIDAPAIPDVLTKQQVEDIIDARDRRLKDEIAAMIKDELAPLKTAIQGKASHAEVDAAITRVVAPLQTTLAEMGRQLEQLIAMHNNATQEFARIGGMVEALTNVKSADMQMLRDRQAEHEHQMDVYRIQLAGVAVDTQQLMSDVRGAGKGEGNPSLFEVLNAVREELKQQRVDFDAAQKKHSGDISDLRSVVDADHKLLDTFRTFGTKALRTAFNASWKAFLKQSVGVQIASVTITAFGTLALGAQAQGWLVPFLQWLTEQLK